MPTRKKIAIRKDESLTDKCGCDCGWKGSYDQMLKAKHPFLDEDIYACPKCKYLEHTVYYMCDEPGCCKKVYCGTPTPKGYRHTCPEHEPHDTTELNNPKPTPWWHRTINFLLLRIINTLRATLITLYTLTLFIPITTLAILWHGNLEKGIETGCSLIDKLQTKDPK
jgi:hypothetical protein